MSNTLKEQLTDKGSLQAFKNELFMYLVEKEITFGEGIEIIDYIKDKKELSESTLIKK